MLLQTRDRVTRGPTKFIGTYSESTRDQSCVIEKFHRPLGISAFRFILAGGQHKAKGNLTNTELILIRKKHENGCSSSKPESEGFEIVQEN